MSSPWLKFYPSDWRADPALRMCSLAARGLWMEMLCVMHEAVPRGTLRINGKPLSERQLCSLSGCAEIAELLAELEEAGVLSREPDGTIYSRRMMRDEAKALEDKANGSKGGNPQIKGRVNPQDKAQKPEARSQEPEEPSSLRSEGSAPAKPTPRSELEAVLDPEHAGAVIEHRKRIGKPMTPRAAHLMAEKFARCPDPNAAADAMIGNGWQGFEPEWLDRPTARGSPPPLRGLEAVAARLRRDIENEQRQNGTAGLDLQDDERLPLIAGPRH